MVKRIIFLASLSIFLNLPLSEANSKLCGLTLTSQHLNGLRLGNLIYFRPQATIARMDTLLDPHLEKSDPERALFLSAHNARQKHRFALPRKLMELTNASGYLGIVEAMLPSFQRVIDRLGEIQQIHKPENDRPSDVEERERIIQLKNKVLAAQSVATQAVKNARMNYATLFDTIITYSFAILSANPDITPSNFVSKILNGPIAKKIQAMENRFPFDFIVPTLKEWSIEEAPLKVGLGMHPLRIFGFTNYGPEGGGDGQLGEHTALETFIELVTKSLEVKEKLYSNYSAHTLGFMTYLKEWRRKQNAIYETIQNIKKDIESWHSQESRGLHVTLLQAKRNAESAFRALIYVCEQAMSSRMSGANGSLNPYRKTPVLLLGTRELNKFLATQMGERKQLENFEAGSVLSEALLKANFSALSSDMMIFVAKYFQQLSIELASHP